jgi:PPP family 3-phenylpropionic acid transporter
MVGGLMAGLLWDDFGAAWVFTAASILSALALWITWKWLERNDLDELRASGEGVSSI